MPIQVTCPSCHARFKVSDKFAGKEGPCPKCKGKIRVPEKSEEVVVHAPDNFGPKNAAGEAVLKPIERTETQVTPVMIAGIVGGIVMVLAVAFVLRLTYADSEIPTAFLGIGAVLLAPPFVLAGYSFLRNDELEPYRGSSLILRVVICAGMYAFLWGVFAFLSNYLFQGDPQPPHMVFVGPALVGAGGVAALATLDLEYGNGCIHYGFYLVVCVLLRLLMGISPY